LSLTTSPAVRRNATLGRNTRSINEERAIRKPKKFMLLGKVGSGKKPRLSGGLKPSGQACSLQPSMRLPTARPSVSISCYTTPIDGHQTRPRDGTRIITPTHRRCQSGRNRSQDALARLPRKLDFDSRYRRAPGLTPQPATNRALLLNRKQTPGTRFRRA
jgi:hypothetical protein